MTVLYNIGHPGFVLDLIHYHYLVNNGKKAYLLIDRTQAYNLDSSLKLNLIFEKVISYNPDFYKITDPDLLIKEIKVFFDSILTSNDICLNNLESVYTQSDVADSFAIYLSLLKRDFYIFEPFPNASQFKNRYDALLSDGTASEAYSNLQKGTGVLCGENHKLIPYGKNGFDYDRAFDKMTKNQISTIFECYNDVHKNIPNNSQMLVFNSPGWLSFIAKNQEERNVLYYTLLDYFGNDFLTAVVKPHPGSLDVSAYYPNDILLDRRFPIEMLKHSKGVVIERLLSIDSSSSDKLEKITKNNIKVGIGFCKCFSYIDQLYFSLLIYKALGVDSIYQDFINDSVFLSILNSDFFVGYQGKIHSNFNQKASIMATNFIADNHGYDQFVFEDEFVEKTNYRYKLNFALESISMKNVNEKSVKNFIYLTNNEEHYESVSETKLYKFYKHLFMIKRLVIIKEEPLDDYEMVEEYIEWCYKIMRDPLWTKDYLEVLLLNGLLRDTPVCEYVSGKKITKDLSYVVMYKLIHNKVIASSNSDEIEWLRRATSINTCWNTMLCSELLKTDNSKLHKEAYERCILITEKNADVMGLLGRMFRDGKGVEKDLDKAVNWMKNAAKKNINWIVETSDTLLKTNNPENWEFAFELCSKAATENNANAMGLLGRMYYYGKGTQKNNSMASFWFEKAISLKSSWKNEWAVIKNDHLK